MKTKHLVPLIVAAGLLNINPAKAQVVLSGTNYVQNFDTIGTGLPTGWTTYSSGSSTALGSLSTFHTAATSWANTSALWWNMASLTNADGSAVPTNSSTAAQAAVVNRVVGVRQTSTAGTGGDPGAAVVVELNDTTIGSSFNVNFDWLMLSDQGHTTTWELDYGLGSSPSFFTKVGQWTNGGELPSQTNLTYIGVTNLSFTFGSALDNQNQPVWIRVAAVTLSTGSGSRCTFGLDNFNLSWSAPVTVTNPIIITTQPTNTTANAEDTATLSVSVTGTAPVYQWYEVVGGISNIVTGGDDSDGSFISGTTGPTLQITSILGAEAGTYFCNISNSTNSTNTSLVTLAVNDPIISIQPQTQTNVTGDIGYFDATAIGSQSMDIQWYYNGVSILDTNSNNTSNQVFVYITNSTAWTNLNGFYMVASNIYGTATSSVVIAVLPALPPTLITRWDFNETNTYSATNPLASIGAGIGSEVNVSNTLTNFLFASGATADPDNLTPGTTNEGWEVQDGPPQGTLNKQVGFQYNTSTVGYGNIVLTWQERHSATASKYMRVQYSPDGSNFYDGPVVTFGEVAYTYSSANLSSYPVINNNSNFAFRVVSEFESTAIGSVNSNYDGTTSTYGPGASGGTIRNDLMTVWGTPLLLSVTTNSGNAVLNWNAASFTLQSATNVAGPYTNVPGAIPGQPIPVSTPQLFFRLISN